MGSVFAVQVMTGMEKNVQKLLNWSLQQMQDHEVKEIHTFCQETRRVLASGDLGTPIDRVFMPGYVFIEMVEASIEEVSAVLWHMIKKIPGVVKQFTSMCQSISAEEFKRMKGLDFEPHVEMVIEEEPDVDHSLLQYEDEIADILHMVNTTISREDREQAELTLQHIHSSSYKERTLRCLKPKKSAAGRFLEFLLNKSLDRDTVSLFSRQHKQGIRFPMSFFEHAKSAYSRWKRLTCRQDNTNSNHSIPNDLNQGENYYIVLPLI